VGKIKGKLNERNNLNSKRAEEFKKKIGPLLKGTLMFHKRKPEIRINWLPLSAAS